MALPPHRRVLPPEPAPSSRLARLQTEIASGHDLALARFWSEVDQSETPFVERIQGDPDHRVVTFVWQDRGETDGSGVLLWINGLTDFSDIDASLMSRLAGTDVWHKSYRLRSDWRATYMIAPGIPPTAIADLHAPRTLAAIALPDPHNPHRFPSSLGGRERSVVELADAPAQPWWQRRKDVPTGTVTEHQLPSRYLGNTRRIWVYTPPNSTASHQPYPLLVQFDGNIWGPLLPIAATLDNLIADRRIPPLVALLVDVIDHETRGRELPCHEPFLQFLTEELLPWAGAHWPVTQSPGRTIVAGESYGGLAAAYAGFRSPDHFGNVLSQSGSFYWQAGTEFDLAAEHLTRQFVSSPTLPVRFYLTVGLQEHLMLPSNRHLRDVLEAKNYDIAYHEYNGGHDYVCWRGSWADGLINLCRDWPARETSGATTEPMSK